VVHHEDCIISRNLEDKSQHNQARETSNEWGERERAWTWKWERDWKSDKIVKNDRVLLLHSSDGVRILILGEDKNKELTTKSISIFLISIIKKILN